MMQPVIEVRGPFPDGAYSLIPAWTAPQRRFLADDFSGGPSAGGAEDVPASVVRKTWQSIATASWAAWSPSWPSMPGWERWKCTSGRISEQRKPLQVLN
jgi:hypothetical protein